MVYLAWRDFQQEDATDGHNRQLGKRQMWDVEFWFLGSIFDQCPTAGDFRLFGQSE